MSPAVQEIECHVQKLSLTDQLWLMEKLTQHIRQQIQVVAPQETELNGDADADSWFTDPDSPLYQDMVEIRTMIKENKLKLYTHDEVWGE